MRKFCTIITGIFLTLLFTTCQQFKDNMEDYLSYWSTEVASTNFTIETPYINMEGTPYISSANDAKVTIKLRNPKRLILKMPPLSDKVIRFSGLSPQPQHGTAKDYTLEQTAPDTLTLTYHKDFLEKYEWGTGDIGADITFIANDSRVFDKRFSVKLKVNTPPALEYKGKGKTQVGSEWYYVLLFRVKDMDTMIGGQRLHKDIKTLNVTVNGGTPVDIPLTFNSSNTDFATGENLLAASAVQKINPADEDLSSDAWVLRLKTNVKVDGPATSYAVSVKDELGFSSEVIKISTDKTKLPDVKLLDGVTPITGTTESAPFSFPGMDGKALTATAHSGAGITGAIYKHDGSSWNEIRSVSGTTPVTVNLPALDSSENEAFYKITLKASLTGYAESNEKEFFVKLLRQELPVLKLKQDFSTTAEQKNISAATKGYVTEDIIPDAENYKTVTTPLAIYNLTGKAQFLLTPRTGSTATVKYRLDSEAEQTPSDGAITVTTSGAHTLKVWAVKDGVEGHKTTLHIKVIGAVTTYRELKNVVQNAPAGNEIGINIDSDLTAPNDIGNTEIAVTDGKKLTLRPNSGDPSHKIDAYERGRIFNIRGGTKLILEDIKLESGVAADEKGGAAYVENGGVLALKGKTVITPSTAQDVNTPGENDVYLAAGALIKIDSALMSTEPIVARITPESYSESTQVLTGTTPFSNGEHDKFTVTQNSDPEYVWAIKNDGNLEKISKTINASSDAWRKLRKLVRIAPARTVITIDGEIKATNDSGNSGEIVIDKNLTIEGKHGATSDILNANSNGSDAPTRPHRIFKVSSHEMLTLKKLTLKNGYAGNGSAGELGTKGGGILLENGRVSLSDVIVSGCKAITNSSWHGDGAGIYVKSGAIIMENSKLSANVASAYGGGIYVNENGWLRMNGSNTITGCSASCGGAICVSGATVNITNCTITGNTAPNGNGGGIYTKKTDSKASTITIKDGAIIGGTDAGEANKATGIGPDNGLGGGIYIGEGCSLKVQSGAQVIGNEATQDGGGIYLNKIDAHGEMSSGEIRNNKAGNGGGVYIAGGTGVTEHASFTLKGGTIIANTATDSGGGVEAFGGGIFTMEGGTIENNTAHNHGGGVQVLSGTMNMTGGNIESNTANKVNDNEKGGGGVALGINNGPALLDMSGGTISRNTIGRPGKGAGIQVWDGTDAVTVKMSGTARIDANNDVYLKDGRKITVDGQLNPLGGVAACITPENYNTTTQVLAGSITDGTPQNYTKFTVTPKEDSGNTYYWEVDNQGKLMRIVDGVKYPYKAWKALKDVVSVAGTDPITINGRIQATDDADNKGTININGAITIKGKNGRDTDILDAGKKGGRIFIINDTLSNKLTLEKLTLKGGFVNGNDGAAILVGRDAEAELSACTIEECEALNGGAIAIWSNGKATLTNTDIKNCSAKLFYGNPPPNGSGGAIYAAGGTVIMTNCTLTGNTAENNGGAVYAKKTSDLTPILSTVTIEGGTIGGTGTGEANKATGTGEGLGGGIYINNSTLKLQNNAKVIGNKASVRGGGIYVGDTDANFTMESGEISSNTVTITESAEIQGGGVCVIDGAKFEMKGGSIKNNTVIAAAANNAKARGGGVCVSGSGSTFIMKDGNPEIINNKVTKADSSNSSMKITTIGGGICVWDNAKFEMQQGTISGNKALEGSGINYFAGAGGGVCVGGKGNADGAGYTNDTAEFKMSGGTISKNEASSNGGGVAVTSNAKFIMTNGTIGGSEADKNKASSNGGGVAVLHGTFEMQNGTVSYNQATGSSGSGGGVYGMNFNSNKGSIIIKGSSSISNNTAMSSGTLAGGGIDGSYKLTIVGDVKIMYNKAPNGFGGGIACSQDSQVELKGCTVEGNTAREPQYGHGVYISYFNNTNTYFKMSGNTKIHKDNNVVLNGSSFITVTGRLSVNAPNYYPSLTMYTGSGYFPNRVVVKSGGSYMLQASDISKFKVTPGGTPQKNWKIVLEGGVGKLKTDP